METGASGFYFEWLFPSPEDTCPAAADVTKLLLVADSLILKVRQAWRNPWSSPCRISRCRAGFECSSKRKDFPVADALQAVQN